MSSENNKQAPVLDSNVLTELVEQATSSWLQWSRVTIERRIELLRKWNKLLSQQKSSDLMPFHMVDFHLQQAAMLIAEPKVMPGPTGESNILTSLGRGSFVVMADEDVPETAFVAMICSALAAGNSLLIAENPRFYEMLESLSCIFSLSELEYPVVQWVNKGHIDNLLLDPRIAGMAYVGNQAEAIRLNACLAQREGQIAQFVNETDLTGLTTVSDPCLVFRFITEKTQTINVTAVGGNASLLALGTGDA